MLASGLVQYTIFGVLVTIDQMTFIEITVLFLRLLFSAATGVAAGCLASWSTGVGVGVFMFFAFPKISETLLKLFGVAPRGSPLCPNGVCSGQSYEWVGQLEGFPICRCKCGFRFVHKGSSFEIVNDDGTTRPFRVWKAKIGWVYPEVK